jgi:hypothetical protein
MGGKEGSEKCSSLVKRDWLCVGVSGKPSPSTQWEIIPAPGILSDQFYSQTQAPSSLLEMRMASGGGGATGRSWEKLLRW